MINVCYTVDATFLGGAERYVSRIATGLNRSRFRPSVVLREPTHPGSGLEEWRAGLISAGVQVVTVPMDLPLRPFRIPSVLRAIDGMEPRIVHVNMPGPQDAQMGLLVPLSRMAGAAGVVVTEHLPMIGSTWKRRLLKRISYLWVDRVATVCHANVPFLIDSQFVPPHKVTVIHNALDSGYGTGSGQSRPQIRERYGLPGDAVVIVFVGNILKHKGLHRIVNVCCEMPGLPWHLLVIGEGPDRERCQTRLKTAGLEGRSTFTGSLPGGEVEALLPAADLLALPSTTEGMPYVILEAMASSLPVVATGVYGIPEMVVDGETGLLVQPGDGGGLARALKTLIADGDKRKQFGAAARSRFESLFTLDTQIGRIEKLYTALARL